MKPARVLFLSEYDVSDINDWSGCPYFMHQALKSLWEDFTAVQVPFDKKRPVEITLREAGQAASEAIRLHQPDLVICQGTSMIPELVANCPVVCWHDACWQLLATLAIDEFRLNFPELLDWDRRFLKRIDHFFMASEWAVNTTKMTYRPFRHKISLLPFGSNFLSLPSDTQIENWRQEKGQRQSCRLVFIGVDWQRKGLKLAIDLQQSLIARGLDTELDILGGQPALNTLEFAGVQVRGFLDKSDSAQLGQFQRLLGEADFLVHPAYRECFGCVLVEANRLGIPALTTPIDGIPTIIKNGENGFLATHGDYVETMSEHVLSLFYNRQHYNRISRQAEIRAQNLFSWDRSARQLKDYCEHSILN